MTKISAMAGPIQIESLIREKIITDITFILSWRGDSPLFGERRSNLEGRMGLLQLQRAFLLRNDALTIRVMNIYETGSKRSSLQIATAIRALIWLLVRVTPDK